MSIAICRQGRRQLQRLNLVSAPPLSAPAQEIFAANVERSVPANGEKPSGRLWILKRTIVLKFHKSFLHHITRSFPVAGNACRELQQRNLKPSQQKPHPLRIRVRVTVRQVGYKFNPAASRILGVFTRFFRCSRC
jgi:hypothetical protein